MNTLLEMTGMKCHELSDDGSIWLISTHQTFSDGDYIPIYAEKIGGRIRFFDDMEVLNHFEGRGYPVKDSRKTKSLFDVLRDDGLTVTDDGMIELEGEEKDAPALFSLYMSSMVHVVDWEKDREKIPDQIVSLSDEAYNFLSAWKPGMAAKQESIVSGVSGEKYPFEYTFDGMPVMAIKPNAQSISSAIKKLLDIKANPDRQNKEIFAVLDDRNASERLRKDAVILQTVSKMITMSRIKKNISASSSVH